MNMNPALRWSARAVTIALALASTSVAAGTDIYRCVLEDGTTAFQATPCPEPAAKQDDDTESSDGGNDDQATAGTDDELDFVNPFDEPESPAAPSEPALPESLSKDRAECEKSTRDEIDAVDSEMHANADAADQDRDYLTELLALTARLRACKQL